MQGESILWSWETWLLLGSLIIVALLFVWRKNKVREILFHSDSAGDTELLTTPREPGFEKPNKKMVRNPFIKITRKNSIDSKQTGQLQFEKIIQETKVISLSMHRLWSDTILDSIYITVDFWQSVSEFLVSNHKPANMSPSEVEIGGFLMGRYTWDSAIGRYKVLLESFIPNEPEKNNIFHLEFSTYSLMMELGDAQDQFPDLVVVGWFHTHPGHGLFLSTPDLAIQRGFFNEKFQFAMEIDSLTADLDLAFFTYQQNGQINNTREPLNCFSWRKLEESI